MKSLNGLKRHCFAACALLGLAAAAIADEPPDFTVVFPAGWACNGFDLQIDVWAGNGHYKEFRDKNGYVRSLWAGKGSALRYTNVTTSKSMSTKSDGAASHTTTYTLDGSQTVMTTGHNLIVMYPSDIPAGPSTTLYMGRVVYTITPPAGIYTIQSTSGRAIDICAALS